MPWTVAMSVPATRTHESSPNAAASAPTPAERLARYFDGDSVSWLNLQATYDPNTLAARDEVRR